MKKVPVKIGIMLSIYKVVEYPIEREGFGWNSKENIMRELLFIDRGCLSSVAKAIGDNLFESIGGFLVRYLLS